MAKRTRGIPADVDLLVGKKYDKLSILGKCFDKSLETGRTFVKVSCECGASFSKNLADMIWQQRKGYPNRCKNCYLEARSTNGKFIKTTYMNNIIQGAKARNITVAIDIAYIELIWGKQNGKCALSGIDLEPPNKILYKDASGKKRARYEGTGSLDRIDSSKGYIKGNVQWIHKTLNTMKMGLNEKDFVDWCIKVVNNKIK